jgi:hypothetical protein
MAVPQPSDPTPGDGYGPDVDCVAQFEQRGQELAASADRVLMLVQQCTDILTRSTAERAESSTPPDRRTLG